MAVITTVKRRPTLQDGWVYRALRLKGVIPNNFPSSDLVVKLFQLDGQVERQAFSQSIDL